MSQPLQSKWGILAATVFMLSPVTEVANAQEQVQLEQTQQGLKIKLQTQGENRPQIFTIKRDNVLVADITNTQVNLQGQNQISRSQPFPGVASLTIAQKEANTVRVIVRGNNSPPEAQIDAIQGGEVTLSLTVAGDATAQSEQTFSSPQSRETSQEREIPSLPESESSSPDSNQPEVMFPNPDVQVNGKPAPNNQQSSPGLKPTRPRATAPPVGDIAVSSINSSPDPINLGTNQRVSRLVLREAPVREVLSLLARSANLNLVFAEQADEEAEQTISVDLENESVQKAFNSILQLSNLQANRRGNTVFVGTSLPQQARNIITRTLRLNEVGSAAAASFLATQGAATQQVFTPTEEIVDPETQRVIREVEQPSEIISVQVAEEQRGESTLLLDGLSVSTDERLNSITLVGEPRQVEIATEFLRQLDARRRQVAVNVKIIDVNLLKTENFNTSFSFGIADTFFSVDGGQATVGVGELSPPSSGQVRTSPLNRPIIPNPNPSQQQFIDPQTGEPTGIPDDPFETGTTGSNRLFLTADGDAVPVQQLEGFGGNKTPLITESAQLVPAIEGEPGSAGSPPLFFDANGNPRLPSELQRNGGQFRGLTNESGNLVPARGAVEGSEAVAPRFFDENGVPRSISELAPFGGEFRPLQDVDSLSDFLGSAAQLTRTFSNFTRFPNQFLGQLEAQVTSGNAKILTDPTLVVQEGQRASVNLTSEVFGGLEQTVEDGEVATNPIIKDAGLIVTVNVNQVNDNGFISLNVNPTVSSPGQTVSTGTGQGNITLLQERNLTSGEIRLRDGQTLILAGIIQDQDRVEVSKVPILGDIPILGSLFRSTNRTNRRQEVIVLLTPQILDDSLQSGGASVNYEPGPGAREMLQQQGYPTPQRQR